MLKIEANCKIPYSFDFSQSTLTCTLISETELCMKLMKLSSSIKANHSVKRLVNNEKFDLEESLAIQSIGFFEYYS
ncbi:CLUMA_CG001921, isoform A [Clunio marinus]|uniref:CLUMA_CG001921, isoform A n=1 Tax=Clunio marinus TaxID=568069 RepID=A0A1J1HJB3_9DIPT|nr:CLUMA_CG001921, isoform A [Clunio marinus]